MLTRTPSAYTAAALPFQLVCKHCHADLGKTALVAEADLTRVEKHLEKKHVDIFRRPSPARLTRVLRNVDVTESE